MFNKKTDEKKTIDPMTRMLAKTVMVHAATIGIVYGGLTLISKMTEDDQTDSE